MKTLLNKKSILVKTLPFVVGIVVLKYALHMLGFEYIELNALFTSFIAANVFLLGFLMAGVLTDFKESEKLPGELSVRLESIADEAQMLYETKKLKEAKECVEHVRLLILCLKGWFYKKERTRTVFDLISALNPLFSAFEPHTQANYIVRLKQEQTNIRRIVTRIDAIRDTSFISSGYRIVEVNSVLLILGLITLRLDPFINSLFLTGSISLLFLYLIFLIKDLDDPFGYHSKDSFENVSIKAIEDLESRLKADI